MPGISDIIFNGIKNVSDSGSEKQSVDGSAKLAAMKNGDTFQAKVVQSSGSDVVLRLPTGETLNARLSSNMALTEGQNVSFEVKNSGSNVTISPLLTNTSADVSVLKALDYAQIPVNEQTSSMTLEMMKAGLPIDRASLLSMYENVRNNPGADISNIVDLTKLSIEVNENSLQNIESYKNLSYQIDRGMQTISEQTDKALLDLVKSDNTEGSFELMNKLTFLAKDYVSSGDVFGSSQLNSELKDIFESFKPDQDPSLNQANEANQANAANPANASNQAGASDAPGIPSSGTAVSDILNAEKELQASDISGAGENAALNDAAIKDPASKALELLKALQNGSAAEDPATVKGNASASVSESGLVNGSDIVQNEKQGEVSLRNNVSDTISLLREISKDPDYKPSDIGSLLKDVGATLEKAYAEGDHSLLKRLISNESVRGLVFDVLKDGWKVSPSDVADKDKIESLYKRLNEHLEGIKESMTAAGLGGSEVMKSVDNMRSNVDFLNQINQMYAYIQLPLKLSGGDTAHGDLYVYSNKKSMTSDDSKVTAFLHLDMDNLGPVDVYVSMDIKAGGRVSTNFTVADDDTLDLLNDHMDMLTDRLKKRGYDITCSMRKKGDEPDPEEDALDKGGVNFLLMHSGMSSASYSAGMRSFDVRA